MDQTSHYAFNSREEKLTRPEKSHMVWSQITPLSYARTTLLNCLKQRWYLLESTPSFPSISRLPIFASKIVPNGHFPSWVMRQIAERENL